MKSKTILDKDYELLHRTEREIIRNEPLDPERNIRLFESMVEFAKEIGRFPPKDPLAGLEEKIEFVKRLQSLARAKIAKGKLELSGTSYTNVPESDKLNL